MNRSLSFNKYPSVSCVLEVLIHRFPLSKVDDNELTRKLWINKSDYFENRIQSNFSNKSVFLELCTFLYPRFKDFHKSFNIQVPQIIKRFVENLSWKSDLSVIENNQLSITIKLGGSNKLQLKPIQKELKA